MELGQGAGLGGRDAESVARRALVVKNSPVSRLATIGSTQRSRCWTQYRHSSQYAYYRVLSVDRILDLKAT